MKWLLLLIFLVVGCTQDEITFKTIKKAPHKEEQQIEAGKNFFAEPLKTCDPPCINGQRCKGGICVKEAKEGSFSEQLKKGQSGMYVGIEYPDYGDGKIIH